MSYTQNTWQNGDVITAEKLNNLEAGVVEAQNQNPTFLITSTVETDPSTNEVTFNLDHTYQEVLEAYQAGKAIWFQNPFGEKLALNKVGIQQDNPNPIFHFEFLRDDGYDTYVVWHDYYFGLDPNNHELKGDTNIPLQLSTGGTA